MSSTETKSASDTNAEIVAVEDCSNSDVVTKYRLAADITNLALKAVVSQCIAGKSTVEVCAFGDSIIQQRCATIFKSKKIDKGIAFPTCVSINEVVCHYSPLPTESSKLVAGDWVKIDLGCHIDGYCAVVAHTYRVPVEGEASTAAASSMEVYEGKQADVLMATHQAMQACLRVIKPGNKNTQVTDVLESIAKAYDVKAVHGTIMHQMKRFVINGNKSIAPKHDPEAKVDTIEFESNEVYAIDVCFTSGIEKPLESEERTTVFKRLVDKSYRLKMKSSRYVFNEINQKYPTLPFSVRAFEDERQARMGVVECMKHELLQPYPVLLGRSGDFIGHLKATVLLLPSGTTRITGMDLPLELIRSDKVVDDDTAALLATCVKAKKKNKKKKAAATTTSETSN